MKQKKYNTLDLVGRNWYNTQEIYDAHVVISASGVLEKNHTEFTNEQLHDITNGFMDLENINNFTNRRLLLTLR